MKNYQLPPGYTWKLGKGFDQQDENSQTMLFNLLLAIAMIYLVMAAVFESTVYPVSIITSIFMAIVGVIWLLFVTRTTITLMAFIGVQILIGVVVNIGIVLVAHINELRSTGMERMAAIVQAGRDRLRPILMTTLTASLGLLPLAAGDASLAVGGGGPSYAPMARSIMGGLLAGAVMSLFVVPAFYVWIDNGAERVKRFMRRTRVARRAARHHRRNQRSRTLKRSQVSSATTLGSLADVTPCEPCASTSPSDTPQDSGIGTVSKSPR